MRARFLRLSSTGSCGREKPPSAAPLLLVTSMHGKEHIRKLCSNFLYTSNVTNVCQLAVCQAWKQKHTQEHT